METAMYTFQFKSIRETFSWNFGECLKNEYAIGIYKYILCVCMCVYDRYRMYAEPSNMQLICKGFFPSKRHAFHVHVPNKIVHQHLIILIQWTKCTFQNIMF